MVTADGTFAYAYDALSRLTAAYSNGTLVVSNRYDHLGRRVQKIAADGTHTFIYDGWRPLVETIIHPDATIDRIDYVWGKDISGTLDGAAGISGLLYVKLNGAIYVPFYDAYGNVMGYRDAEGNVVAEYVYDAFGRTVAQNCTMADMFAISYSTKYYDAEVGLYYYGKRHYSPVWRRWLTRDPIGEDGGVNLYGFCKNGSVYSVDPIGKNRYRTVFSLDPRKDQWHVGVAVDTWQCRKGRWQKTGVASFDFGTDDSSLWNRLGTFFVTVGEIVETPGNTLTEFTTISSSPRQDIEMLKRIRAEIPNPPLYSFFFNNCIQWSNRALRYGMEK